MRPLIERSRSANQAPSRWSWVALLAVAALGLALRLWQTRESLWIDELHTAWCALGQLDEVARRAALGNQSPLFFWLQWLLVRMFGASELVLRLPSVIAGSLLPVALYWLVDRWTRSAWLGVLAAALVVVDRLSIFYATEARPYALIQLLAALHVALVAELAVRPGIWLRLGFVAGAALLFYLHYTAALVVAGEVAFLAIVAWQSLSHGERVNSWVSLAVDLTLLGILVLPAIPNLAAIYARRDNWAAFVEHKPLWTVFTLLPWSASALIVIVGAGVYRWRKRKRDSHCPVPPVFILLAVCWLLVPLSLAWGASAMDAARLFFPRYLIAAAPAAFVLAAMCFRFIPWRYWQLTLAAGLLAYATYNSQIIEQWRYDGRLIGDRQEDWRGAVAWLNEQLASEPWPILLRSGLIEADGLDGDSSLELRDYCRYPLTSLYPVHNSRIPIVPLPNRIELSEAKAVLPQLREHPDCWLVWRGSSVPVPAGHIRLSKSFGKLHVALVTIEASPPKAASRVRSRLASE